MNTLEKLQKLQQETGIFDVPYYTPSPPEPVIPGGLAGFGGYKARPGYYGHNSWGLVFVALLDCPSAMDLDEAKRAAGVMTVRAYFAESNSPHAIAQGHPQEEGRAASTRALFFVTPAPPSSWHRSAD